MAIVKSSATSYKLIYKAEQVSDVRVQILDANKALVYSEVIRKTAGFARPYNFEGLAEGEYTIQIDNGANGLTETVKYSSGRIEKLAHLVSLKDGKYMLTVAGKGEEELTVQIFNKDGESVFSEDSKINGDFGKIYNLSHLSGPFSFEVTGKSGALKMVR